MASSISERTRRTSAVAVAMLAAANVAFGVVPVAHAAVAPDATREAARAKLVEGVDAMKRGDYGAALDLFQQAYTLVPSPNIHYDFGQAYLGLGRPADALSAFERFLAEAPDAPAEKREKAASLVSTLRARASAGSARGGRDADGNSRESPGPPVANAAPPSAATSSPAKAELLEHGDEHAMMAAGPDHDPLRARRIAAVSLSGAGVGLVAAGLVFGALAEREGNSLTRDSQMATPARPTPFDPSKESQGLAYERLQIIGLVTGGIAIAAGAVLYATSRRRVSMEPFVGQSHAGAGLRLAF
jgi:hypothetical protein